MKPLTVILVGKAVMLAVAGVGLALSSRGAFGKESEGDAGARSGTAEGGAQGAPGRAGGESDEAQSASAVPPLPKNIGSLSEAERIRLNLELLRRDAEAKTKALVQARQAYERTRRTVEQRLKDVKEQKALLDDTLQKEKETKAERLKEALVFLEKMEPRKAAPVVEAMDRDLVIALFKKLPSRVVTRILENVNPRKATELMEYYTRIRSGREFAMLRELGLCREEPEEAAPGKEAAPGGGTGQSAPAGETKGSGASGASGAADAAKETKETGSGAVPAASGETKSSEKPGTMGQGSGTGGASQGAAGGVGAPGGASPDGA